MPTPFVPGPAIYDLIVDAQKDRAEVEAKVERAIESVRDAASVVTEIKGSLQQHAEKLEALKSEL